MKPLLCISIVLFAASISAFPQLAAPAPAAQAPAPSGLLGDWKSTAGSIVRVGHCGAHLCLSLVQLIHTNGATTDIHNPDPALHARPLCGLRIGSGFTLVDPDHAIDGALYDPQNGKSYRGSMTLRSGVLYLRGYVGIPLFGSSQTWTRPTEPVVPCAAGGSNEM